MENMDAVYNTFLREFLKRPKFPDDIQDAFAAVDKAQLEYFGGTTPDMEKRHSIMDKLFDKSHGKKLSMDFNELRDENIAACSERSALTHNLLKMILVNTTRTVIKFNEPNPKDNAYHKGNHVVNFVNSKNGDAYLLDFSQRVEGKYTSLKIPQQLMENFWKGGQIPWFHDRSFNFCTATKTGCAFMKRDANAFKRELL